MDDDIIFDHGITRETAPQIAILTGREAAGTQRNRLVNAYAVTDHRGFSNHDARAVIDEEAAPDTRAGVNVDAPIGIGYLRDDPGDQRRAKTVQQMRQTMMDDRDNAWIADQDFVDAARSRIARERCLHVQMQCLAKLPAAHSRNAR